ncbi:MAG: YccF domain-containing protein [Chloroflexaceae bacterium]|nr:YccF domain-containing protein [Chloroflexaceae bacterium]NJO08042.1 YccF domain-containing protein [Chloroflexaceae bacterium]
MTTTTIRERQGLGMLLLRLLYFFLVGLWLSGIWAAIAWVLCVTIIGLPLGLWMLNRLPQITTLQPETRDLVITATGETYVRDVPQHNFIIRALYFFAIGWWFSAIWMSLAWALSASIIGLPISFWMFNRVPAIITLQRS